MMIPFYIKYKVLIANTVNAIERGFDIGEIFPIRASHDPNPILKCNPRIRKPLNVVLKRLFGYYSHNYFVELQI